MVNLIKKDPSGRVMHKKHILVLLLFFCCSTLCRAHDASAEKVPHILYINSYHPGYTWSDMIHGGIRETLTKRYGKQYDLRVEHLDAKRYAPELAGELGETIRSAWRAKYSKIPIDIILVSDQDGYNFISRFRNELFPGVPLLFSGVEEPGEIAPNTTGVLASTDYAENLALILNVLPNLKELWVVTDPSTTGAINRRRFDDAAQAFAGKMKISCFDENNQGIMPDPLIQKASSLGDGAAIFFLDYYRTPQNDAVNVPVFLEKLCGEARVPVFSHVDIYIDFGVTGGYMNSGKVQGCQIAELAVKIIEGVEISTLQPEIERAVPIFDEKKMKQFGIPEKNLPKNSFLKWNEEIHPVRYSRAFPGILSNTIYARGDHHYPPFEFINSKGEPDGFNVEIIKAVAASMGMEVKIELGVWDEVRQQLEEGDIDLLIGMFNTPERDRKVDFSIPMFLASYAVYVRDDPTIKGMDDLKNKTVLLQKGDLAYDYVTQNRIANQVIEKSEWTDVLLSLSKGEGDAALVSRLQGNEFIESQKLTNIKAVGPPVIQRKYCMAVTEGNSLLLARINEGLSLIKTSGEYDRIYQKWFGVLDREVDVALIVRKVVLWVVLPSTVLLFIAFGFSWMLRRQVQRKTRELKESEQKARAVFDQSFQFIGLLTTEGILIDANRTALSFINIPPAEVLGKPFWDTPWWSHSPEVQENLKNAIRKAALGETIHYETNHRDANGVLHYIDFSLKPVKDEQGHIIYLVPEGRDITHIKQSEESLRESESKYRDLVESASAVIITWDRSGNLRFFNEFAEKLFSFTASEVLGKNLMDTIVPRTDSTGRDLEAMIRDIVRYPERYIENENENITKDGRRLWLRWTNKAILSPKGTVEFILSIGIDNTARRIAQIGLKRLDEAIKNINEVIIITDARGIIQYINPAFERTTGYSQEEALGADINLLESGKHDKEFYQSIQKIAARGETWKGYIINKKKDGTPYDVEATISNVRGPDDTIINYITVQRDITREMKLEQQYRQAQKMESIGTLAGGIAHDFNNILGAILGYTQIAMDEVSDRPKTEKHLQEVLKATDRATALVKQILTFSRKTEQEKKPVMPRVVVKEALKLLRASLPATIEIRQAIQSDSVVFGDSTQIHQVVMNLCTNAGYAMREKGGVLEVSLEDVALDEAFGREHPGITPGKHVRLNIADTGCGIPREILNRIFDPFFTTKPQGEGTGLGLSVVHGIVQSCGGTITVYSEENRGTIFNIYLPVIQAEVPATTRDQAALPRGTEKILFVDDEPMLGEVGRQVLESLGYRVTVCNGSVEALSVFRNDPQGFDVIITDYTMPQMTGLELAQEIIKTRNTMPIMLCTGYSETVTKEKAQAANIQELIFKPITKREMANKIRNILDGKID